MTNFKFISISANPQDSGFEAVSLLPAVISLMEKYKHFLTDDFYPKSKPERFKAYVELINSFYPHFYVILNRADFVGFVYLSNWKGNEKQVYSCHLTCCFHKKYWGKHTLECARQFITLIEKNTGVRKIKAQVFEHNFRIKKLLKNIGFKFEGVSVEETMQGAKPMNVVMYGLLCGER